MAGKKKANGKGSSVQVYIFSMLKLFLNLGRKYMLKVKKGGKNERKGEKREKKSRERNTAKSCT